MPKTYIALTLAALAACTALVAACDPTLDPLQQEIRSKGYIPYSTPLEHARTGTLIGGTPSRMQIVARPDSCFPDILDGQLTDLRFRDNTSLPSRQTMTSFGFEANVKMLKNVSTNNGTLSAGAKFGYVSKMEMRFEGVHVEVLDSVRLAEFYRAHLSQTCKSFLESAGPVMQAIQTEKLTFKFYNKAGGAITIDTANIQDYIDISANISFEVQNNVELVITTPRYLGYQLGKLQKEDNGMVLYRSTRTSATEDKYLWEPVSVFDPDKPFGSNSLDAAVTEGPFELSLEEARALKL